MAIELTEAAVSQVRRMKAKHDLGDDYGLRIGVKAGGCAGREYVLDLEEGPGEKDRVFEFEDVKVFVDPRSYLFVNGLCLDFFETMLEHGFKFENPNAASSCGCGTSFTT